MTETDELQVSRTAIPGLLVLQLPLHGDNRGWFKENWQRQKMVAAGLPDFGPVQNNVSFNSTIGTTRGIHAEPWDKYISVATGRVFGAWVDLRAGSSFGEVHTAELNPSTAIYVPRGVGNSFQTLEPNTAYTYLVNDYYSADAQYAAVNLADDTLAIPWPIPLNRAELSSKDRDNPSLLNVRPIAPRKTIVLGAAGQLGRALLQEYANDPNVEFAGRSEIDLLTTDLTAACRWSDYDTIINAAAYTSVDEAETASGRVKAWATNVVATSALASLAATHGITLVHVSSDYVFDGCKESAYDEGDQLCPLGVYGQTKAAGDQIAATVPRHYVVRTSWVVGDGRNFVRTMLSLADRGVDPLVVNDQFGRLTFTSELARAIRHLLRSGAPYGLYNVTNSGPSQTWSEVARQVFSLAGYEPCRVTGVTTAKYFAGRNVRTAPRPTNSILDLSKIISVGHHPTPSEEALERYVRCELGQTPITDDGTPL